MSSRSERVPSFPFFLFFPSPFPSRPHRASSTCPGFSSLHSHWRLGRAAAMPLPTRLFSLLFLFPLFSPCLPQQRAFASRQEGRPSAYLLQEMVIDGGIADSLPFLPFLFFFSDYWGRERAIFSSLRTDMQAFHLLSFSPFPPISDPHPREHGRHSLSFLLFRRTWARGIPGLKLFPFLSPFFI